MNYKLRSCSTVVSITVVNDKALWDICTSIMMMTSIFMRIFDIFAGCPSHWHMCVYWFTNLQLWRLDILLFQFELAILLETVSYIVSIDFFTGHMFHRKPLYVAIAQRREERLAQLQLQYAQRMAGLAGPSAIIPAGAYPPFYYTAPPGIVSPVPPRPGLIYQPLGFRPGWRANGFAPSTRPVFQQSSIPMVSSTVFYGT